MAIPQINNHSPNSTLIVKDFPDEVVYEFTKYIDKLIDFRNLSLVSQHFFQVIFNSNFPIWHTLLTSHFPSSFEFIPQQIPPMGLYQNLKAIDNHMRTGIYQTRTLAGHQGGIFCLEAKEGMLFSASSDGIIKIWDLPTGNELRCLSGHQNSIQCLKVTDGKLISGSWDQTIKIWDIASGKELHSLTAHRGIINCLEVIDGMLISGSEDKTIKIWDIGSGKELQ